MKRTILGITLVAMLGVVGIVGAQEPNNRERNDEVHAIIETATGLEGQELREALRDGATPADLIAANGGDVEAVEAEIVAAILAEHPEADAAEVAERAANLLNGVRPERGDRGGNLDEIVESTTGLDLRELRQEARENDQTLAEVISANGGDVTALSAALTAEITSQHPELDAAEVAERVDNFLNKIPQARGQNAPRL